MDVLREWEEFEREFFEKEAESQRVAERQHRAEKKVSLVGLVRRRRFGHPWASQSINR